MRHILLFSGILLIPVITLHCQDLQDRQGGGLSTFLHVEAGAVYPDGKIRESIAIRQNISSYFVDQVSNGRVSAETYGIVLGIQYEYFSKKFKTGLSGGVRYTGYRTAITGYSSYNSDFFYLRYSMVDSDTKFARVKEINETNNMFSLPVEMRFVPLVYKKCSFFIKAGGEFIGYDLWKDTNINFQEASMDAFEHEILDQISIKSNNYYATVYGSVGVTAGNENKTGYSFEIFFPSLFLSKNNFALTNVNYYEGFRFSIQFPVIKQY